MNRGFLDQDFGSGSEDEDDTFNPQPGRDSDDEEEEGSTLDSPKQVKRPDPTDGQTGKSEPDAGSAMVNGSRKEQVNGDERQSESKERSGSRSRMRGDDEHGVDDEEVDGEAGEDEGEGEDLGDSEGDEDEDDDDDDDDEDVARPRKRRRRGLNAFFEEEAEVDEDDDDEVEEEEEAGFVADTHPDDLEQLPEGEREDDRRHRELDRRREMEASLDAERQAELFKSKYGRRQGTGLRTGSFVPQNLLMPDVNDPSIWGIKCKPGKEREVIFKVMRRFMERGGSRNPMRICSAFERGASSMTGYIFVEARRKADVDDALNGIPDVYPRAKMNLVPVKEMPDLLRVIKSQELQPDGYVRIKRGLYQGDLAVIQDVESNGLTVTVRLVPRLTYGLDEDDQARPTAPNNQTPDGKRKRLNAFGPINSVANRPPQRLFNENEAKKRHGKFLTQTRGLGRNSWSYKGEQYEDGFLIKDYRLQHLITTDVNPRLDEITKLTRTADDGTETLDLESLAHSLRNNTAEGTYMPGDEVEVYEGEQRGIVGRTEATSGNIVSIKVSEGDLKGQVVEVPMKGLRKRFKEGDHVKIIGGSRYRDEVGMVIKIKDDRVTVLTDNNVQEITVFSKDLREATDSGGATGQTKFDVQELVQLDPATVAIVIKADRESVRVLDQDGSVSTRLPSQITKIETRKTAVATDKNGSEIRVGDVVRELGGEGKTGTILHLHRSYVFVHNRTQLENSGLWTTRSTNVVTTAAKGARNPGTDLSKMNPALQMRNGTNGAMPPPKSMGRDPLLGKQVKVRKGGYKGNNGLVKDTTDTTARVELQATNKIVTVEKEHLMVIDPNTGKGLEYNQFRGSRGAPGVMRTGLGGAPPRIPDSSRTPMGIADGGRTPAWGASSRTPAWGGPSNAGDSGRTPAWKGPGGSQTSYGGAGNMTTYGGTANYGATGGGRTPAWSSNARTPYGTDHGFGGGNASNSGFDAFAAGSRTPAYGGGSTSLQQTSRTPAWAGPNSAPTPAARAYDAPTPAAASAPTPAASGGKPYDDEAYTPQPWSAPTPGAYPSSGAGPLDAPTPAPSTNIPSFAKDANKIPLSRSRFDAPTPAANAPTPYASGIGAYDAPTPAVGGGSSGGGPRYAEDSDDD